MADLVTALRRAEGYNNNRERFITELRARKRLRNEDIWSYHLALANLAKKAYPDNAEMQAGSLRESFIANLNEPYLASRLRELANLNEDELLDQAIIIATLLFNTV